MRMIPRWFYLFSFMGIMVAFSPSALAHKNYNYLQTSLWRSLGQINPYTVINPFMADQNNLATRYWRTGITGDLYPSYYHRYYKEFMSKNRAYSITFMSIYQCGGQKLWQNLSRIWILANRIALHLKKSPASGGTILPLCICRWFSVKK